MIPPLIFLDMAFENKIPATIMKICFALSLILSRPCSVLGQGHVNGFTLINADTDLELRPIVSGDTIDLDTDGTSLSLRADTSGSTGSVRFELDGSVTKTENVPPYALGGDSSGDYSPVAGLVELGLHTVAATPFSAGGGGGTQGTKITIQLQVIDSGSPPTFPATTPPTVPPPTAMNPPTLAPGLHPDIVRVIQVVGANPGAGWHDSYSVGNECFCETSYDHNIGSVMVETPLGVKPVSEVCQLLGSGPGSSGRPKYNDVQCGNGPPNDAGDEDFCPGRVDIGPDGCGQIGPIWNFARFLTSDVRPYPYSPQGAISGELRKWHKITLGFEGPSSSETSSPNPFTDFRLDVQFTHSGSGNSYTVPGYYSADGNAANSGASAGNVWICHFAPDQTGTWTWLATFEQGNKVAQNGGGSSAGFFDGATGQFDVAETNKSGRDHRGKGLLKYVGEHHLQFSENDEWFLKAGADSPENFLAYDDFDNTPNSGGRRKSWAPHAGDFNEGDPTWNNGKGKNIIGAINYLSEKGMNAVSFLPMNINGDDKNVFPYISDNTGGDRQRIDVSKTAQWEVVFEHADKIGLYLHFKTQETENDQLLDGGALGDERKFYYRELVARFGHHLALNWNLGEENTNTNNERKAFSDFFKQLDPYKHPVVVHTFPGSKQQVYGPLLGYPSFDGASLQSGVNSVFSDTKDWVSQSAASGKKWIVANDEQGSANTGIKPDIDDPDHDDVRETVLWGNIMAGGAGVEYYFGYALFCDDLDCEDYRSRENMWDQSRHALEFFSLNNVPFWDMSNDNSIVSNGWALVQSSEDNVVVYLPDGTANIDLSSGTYSVSWYDPRNGGALQSGSIATLNAGNNLSIGTAPNNQNKDWVILLQRSSQPTAPTPTVPAPTPTAPTTTVPASSPPTPSPASPLVGSITGFVLIDAATDIDIGPLNPDDTVNLAVTGTQLSIRADSSGSIGSVGFALDNSASFQTENFAVYALGGNSGSNYYAVNELVQPGLHTVTATPYSGKGKSGTIGTPVSITFVVV